MLVHVMKVYKNSGFKPAVKTALRDLREGSAKKAQKSFYKRSLFSQEQKENTHVYGYRIIQSDGVKLHCDMMCELSRAVDGKSPALVYMDELRDGKLLYKPDFAPDNLASHNYIGSCVAVREDVLDGKALELAGEDNLWSFNRYICGKCRADEICHISRALFEDMSRKETYNDKTDYFAENNIADNNCDGKSLHLADEKNIQPLVSIIIPNYEHRDDLKCCIDSLLEINSYRNIEIIIVENNSKSDEIFAYYRELEENYPQLIRVMGWDGSFNYSAINNYGAAQAKGELLLLLNNDTKIIEQDSIERMVLYAMRGNTGAVGACLLYEDKTIQHSGVIVGIGPDRTAVHPNAGVSIIERGYRDSIHHVQNYSAVTGACLMVKKKLYEEIGGLSEEFAVAYNDVDFCLRLRQRGLLNVYVPDAMLYHFESKSRGYDNKGERHERFLRESEMFRERWQAYIEDGDMYYNPNLSKDRPWDIRL